MLGYSSAGYWAFVGSGLLKS